VNLTNMSYRAGMIEETASTVTGTAVETVLRDELAQGDAMFGTIAPIMRHLLASSEHSVFGDEIIARVRGMFADVARQLLDALARAEGEAERIEHPAEQVILLVEAMVAQPAVLAHLHALALEWQLTERIEVRLAVDPVLPPLLQSLVASGDAGVASLGMALLASQARFVQAQRRMQLPIHELPGDQFFSALQAMRGIAGTERLEAAVAADAELRASYDESRSRLGLIARLVTGMGGGATVALSAAHAGVAMFLTALSLASGQDRDLTVMSTNEGQLARLALALRSAGLRPEAVGEQFATLHPEVELPSGFDALDADRAASLLASSAPVAGH
jgi:hypothetical protein